MTELSTVLILEQIDEYYMQLLRTFVRPYCLYDWPAYTKIFWLLRAAASLFFLEILNSYIDGNKLVTLEWSFGNSSTLMLLKEEMLNSKQFTKSLFGDLLEELKGAHLRIAATHVSLAYRYHGIKCLLVCYMHLSQVPPAMIIEKNSSDGTFRYSGYSADACLYLSQQFKFT